MIEQGRPEEEAAFAARDAQAAAVDDELRARAHAVLDVARDLVAVRGRDQRTHVGARRAAVVDRERADARRELRDELVGDVADGDGDRDRHAALAGRAVAGADQRVGGLLEVGVGHDDHVVLRAAERLHAFAVPRSFGIDVLGDGRRADEADGRDVGMREQRGDGFLVALHDVEHALRQPGLFEQLRELERRARIALARLQHERVAARDRERKHPHRHHGREVERRDADAHADGLAQRPVVDVAADVVAVLALQQLGNAARELDDLDAARELAFGVGEHLAVLARDERRELVEALVEQLLEAGTARARASAVPCRPSLGSGFGRGDGAPDDGRVGQAQRSRSACPSPG